LDQENGKVNEYAIEWTRGGLDSLGRIMEYIAQDKPGAAEKFRDEALKNRNTPRVGIFNRTKLIF